MVRFFSENGEIFAHYKRKVCQMKQQVKRSSLSIYLGVGEVSGKSPKIGLEFKNISGSEKLRYSYKKKSVTKKQADWLKWEYINTLPWCRHNIYPRYEFFWIFYYKKFFTCKTYIVSYHEILKSVQKFIALLQKLFPFLLRLYLTPQIIYRWKAKKKRYIWILFPHLRVKCYVSPHRFIPITVVISLIFAISGKLQKEKKVAINWCGDT